MIKEIKLLLFSCLLAIPIYAQNSTSEIKVVEQVWNKNKFSSDKALLDNIEAIPELEKMLELLIKADIESLSESQARLSFFIPLDSSLDKMKPKARRAFFKNTSKEELNAILKNSIVPARLDSYSIKRNIENNNQLPIIVNTLGNNTLEFALVNNQLVLRDSNGNQAKWIKGDFYYKNGLFHFIEVEVSKDK